MAVALLLCTSLASCSRDDFADTKGDPLTPGEYPMELTAGGLQTVVNQAQASTRTTVDDDWNGVSTVAVQVRYDVKSYNVTSAETVERPPRFLPTTLSTGRTQPKRKLSSHGIPTASPILQIGQ